MWRLTAAFVAFCFALALSGATDAAGREVRDHDDLQEIFAGTLLAGIGPEGRHFKSYLYNDGKVMLEAAGHPADAGRWWIEDQRFCVDLRHAFQGKPTCFAVFYGGATKIDLSMETGITLHTRAVGRAISLSLR